MIIFNKIFTQFSLLTLLLGFGQAAFAGTVYQWTDEEGNIIFSDMPPPEHVTATKEIQFNDYETNGSTIEDAAVFEQLEKITALRKQKEEERLARKRLVMEERRLAEELELRKQEVIAAENYQPRVFYPPYSTGRIHHPHRVRPDIPQVNPVPVDPARRNIIPRKYGPVHL